MSRSVARPRRRSVVAVVAAWNEEATVASTVKSLGMVDAVTEVVVAADGCSDRTVDEARGAGARVIARQGRVGKGAALGAAVARTPNAEVYLLVDADVEDSAAAAEPLLDEVLAGRLDLAIGRLPPLPGGGFGLVKAAARAAIGGISGWWPEAPLSGQRAVAGGVLRACLPLARGFGVEAGMTIDAVRLGFRVGEVPVAMAHRSTGRTLLGFTHRARQGVDILLAVVPRAAGAR